MIREVPNRYEKLNFSSDDIQKQLDNQSQGSPRCDGGLSQGTINPITSHLIINSKESQSILGSQSSSSPSENVSLRSDSNKSSRGSSASQDHKLREQNDDDPSPSKRPVNANQNNKNGNQNIIKQLFFKKLPTNSNNYSQNSMIKESLTNPFTQFKTKKAYYVESNPSNNRKRRLLSFNGEETGEFRDLVTFLDKAKQGDEMPAHKMIRKNSCCCHNCGAKTSKEAKLDKLIPKFKPTQVIKMMYRRAFQKTISNVSKINKFFRSKLSIRTNNNNHFLFGEKKASPTKFTRQSTFKISPKSTEKLKLQQQKSSQKDITENLQKLSSLNMIRNREGGQILSQSSSSQNESPHSVTNEQKNKKTHPTIFARNSLVVYSNGEQNSLLALKLLQNNSSPFKKSSFQNHPNSNSDQFNQQSNLNTNEVPQNPQQNLEQEKQAAPPKLSNTSSGISVTSQQALNNGINNNNNGSNNSNQVSGSNTPQYPAKKKTLLEKVEQPKNKNNTQNIIVEDNIIDQLRQETKIGNINNEFVKSVGNKQTLSNIPKDQQDLDSDRAKSKRTLVILEDVSEIAQNQEQEKMTRNLYVQSYYRTIPKISNKYMNPVLIQLRSASQSIPKKNGLNNSKNHIQLRTLADIPTDISMDKNQRFLTNQTTPFIDSKCTTQVSDVEKINSIFKSSSNDNKILLNQFSSVQNLQKINKNLFSNNEMPTFPTKKNLMLSKITQAEGKKKIQMKRQQKNSSQNNLEQFNSVYLQKSISSCTQLSTQKQKVILEKRPPFNLSLKQDLVRNTEHLHTPIKILDQQNKTHKSKLFDKLFFQKTTLPEINFGSTNSKHLADSQIHSSIQKDKKQSNFLENDISQTQNQSFDNFTKGVLSPFKITNKKKKNSKSKSITIQNRNIFEVVELNKKGNSNSSYQPQFYISHNN